MQPVALFAACALLCTAAQAQSAVKFRHIIIVDQENRTPDNLFGSNPGFEPGVDIASAGISSTGQTIPLAPAALSACWDLNHSHGGFVNAFMKGADKNQAIVGANCTAPKNAAFSYVDNSTGTVQPYFDIATSFGFANYMFQTNQGPSFPSHQIIFGGTSAPSAASPLFVSENLNNTTAGAGAGCIAIASQTVNLIDGTGSEKTNAPIYPCLDHLTLADRLDAAHLTWRYYVPTTAFNIWNAPITVRHLCVPQTVNSRLTCTGSDFANGSVNANSNQILTDITGCALPAVSWVIPTAANSDHATVNTGTGPQWVASIVNAVGQQTSCPNDNYWQDTAILITWDDWGGFYDHVIPFLINVQPYSPAAWGDGYTYGFRVPLLVVSAYTPAGYVDNIVHDYGSLLYFTEQNFNLPFIGPGDTIYSNYADYQAAARGDSLYGFFSLATPRAFTPVNTRLSASYFLHQPRSDVPPDD